MPGAWKGGTHQVGVGGSEKNEEMGVAGEFVQRGRPIGEGGDRVRGLHEQGQAAGVCGSGRGMTCEQLGVQGWRGTGFRRKRRLGHTMERARSGRETPPLPAPSSNCL